VNRAPATGESETSSAGESSTESSTASGQAVAALAADGSPLVYPTIGDMIDTDPRLSYLSMLLHEAGISDVVTVTGPITVFAPTDEAFEELPADTDAQLRSDPDLLSQVLGHHIADGLYLSADLTTQPVVVFDDHQLAVTTDGDTILVEGVPIVDADRLAGNGVVHVVDHLLTPGELDLTGTAAP